MKVEIVPNDKFLNLTIEEIEDTLATKGYDGWINRVGDVYILRNQFVVCLTKDNGFVKEAYNTLFTVKSFCYIDMKVIIV